MPGIVAAPYTQTFDGEGPRLLWRVSFPQPDIIRSSIVYCLEAHFSESFP